MIVEILDEYQKCDIKIKGEKEITGIFVKTDYGYEK